MMCVERIFVRELVLKNLFLLTQNFAGILWLAKPGAMSIGKA
jgi:hypothetical protein